MPPRMIEARYSGWCRRTDGGCGSQYREGARIGKVAGRWCCETCALALARGERAAPAPDAPVAAAAPSRFGDFTASRYQAAVRDAVVTQGNHIVILAVAGSGKTTTIEWLLQAVPQTILGTTLFLAFNRAIRAELATRTRDHPGRPQVRTLHSAGLSLFCAPAWRTCRPRRGNEPARDLHVSYQLAGERAERLWPTRVSGPERARNVALHGAVVDLVTYARHSLIGAWQAGAVGDWTDAALARLVERHAVELDGASGEMAEVFQRTRDLRDDLVAAFHANGLLDGAGMIWLPIALDLAPSETYATVMVDETQDLSIARVALALRLAGRTGRVIAVGDERQAIYGFAGADTESLANLRATLAATSRGVSTLPLDVCYRCATAVIDLVRSLGLHETIQAREGAPVGTVAGVPESAYLERIQADDDCLILCRTNAPLVRPCFALIRRGIAARIQGRDVGAGLAALVRQGAHKRDEGRILACLANIREYVERQVPKLRAAGHDAQADQLEDKAECVYALADGVGDVDDLLARIAETFRDDGSDRVVFSTVHKAKGLEAADVYIIRPDLMPGPWARAMWERVQEDNLRYVAYTRAKRALYFVGGPVPTGRALGADEDGDDPVDPPPPTGGGAPVPVASAGPLPTLPAGPLPTLPTRGARGAVEATLAEWETVRDLYQAAGLVAVLADDIAAGTRFAWRQYALLVGPQGAAPVVRVSTTIDIRTRRAREKDANAIDVARIDARDGPPCAGSRRKVLRTENWQGRTCERINGILRDAGLAGGAR